MSEYLLTAAYRPDTLSWDNFLLNHSTSYKAMVLLCWVEYWAEWCFLEPRWPGSKQWSVTTACGLAVSVVGLATRSIAMATASSNFSHIIEGEKRQA